MYIPPPPKGPLGEAFAKYAEDVLGAVGEEDSVMNRCSFMNGALAMLTVLTQADKKGRLALDAELEAFSKWISSWGRQ